MAKYFTYEGKPVGYIRKMIDQVVLVESGWVGAVNNHFAKKGYDGLLVPIAQILADTGHPPISRAQAWLILHDLTNSGVPEALRNVKIDEKAGLGKLFNESLKRGAEAVDTTVSAGKTVGGKVVGVARRKDKASEGDESDSE